MNILGLDFGTKTGFCYGAQIDKLAVGTWTLAAKEEITAWHKARQNRTRDPRIQRLAECLKVFPMADLVVFEDVNFSSTTYQSQLWASFRTVAWLEYPGTVRFDCVGVSTLKKFATGAGNATKPMMLRAAQRNPLFEDANLNLNLLDDNGIDALFLWAWAKQNLGRSIT